MPDLRPVGVDHLGPRDRAPRPQHGQRPVVEAAAGVLHDALLARSATTRRPNLWLVVARAGGMLAIAMAYRLGARLGGRSAGVIAALRAAARRRASSATSRAATPRACSSRSACGRSSATSTAAAATPSCSASPPRCCGRRCGRSSALYGLWLALGRAAPPRVLVVGVFAACGVLWFVPEYWGSGDWLRAANRAHQPNPDSAAFADRPFLEVFRRSAPILSPPVLLGGADRARARRSASGAWDVAVLALAAAATVLMIVVAAMTQAGFAGNLRYVALPAALVCVLAGVGWVGLDPRRRRALRAHAAGSRSPRCSRSSRAPFVDRRPRLAARQRAGASARRPTSTARCRPRSPRPAAPAKVKRCKVYTGNFQTQAVAWYLNMPRARSGSSRTRPASSSPRATRRDLRDPRFPLITDDPQVGRRRRCSPESRFYPAADGDLRLTPGVGAAGPRRSRPRGSSCPSASALLVALQPAAQRASSASASGSTRGCRSGSPTGR